MTCDRCDSPAHATLACPHYRRAREDHPDARRHHRCATAPGERQVVRTDLRVVRQPGDGSCMFHSFGHFVPGLDAAKLRRGVCRWIERNTQTKQRQPLRLAAERDRYMRYSRVTAT